MKALKYIVLAIILAAGFTSCVVEQRPGYYRYHHPHYYHHGYYHY